MQQTLPSLPLQGGKFAESGSEQGTNLEAGKLSTLPHLPANVVHCS